MDGRYWRRIREAEESYKRRRSLYRAGLLRAFIGSEGVVSNLFTVKTVTSWAKSGKFADRLGGLALELYRPRYCAARWVDLGVRHRPEPDVPGSVLQTFATRPHSRLSLHSSSTEPTFSVCI